MYWSNASLATLFTKTQSNVKVVRPHFGYQSLLSAGHLQASTLIMRLPAVGNGNHNAVQLEQANCSSRSSNIMLIAARCQLMVNLYVRERTVRWMWHRSALGSQPRGLVGSSLVELHREGSE